MKKHCNQAGTPPGTTWRISSNELYTCRVADPRDLPGIHADNMMAGLAPGERLRYLLYSPIWEGKLAPFGITAEPASHAFAVAQDRFLISRDSHVKGAAPVLRIVPFSDVLYVQLGSSFCLGWFAVLFAEPARPAYKLLLFQAIRKDRFAAAIREYRSSVAQGHNLDPAQSEAAWDRVWGQDLSQAQRIRELLVFGERPIRALHSSELWVEQRSLWKRKWSCIVCEELLLATDIGIFHVARETYDRLVTWNIGMNVVYVPHQAVRSAAIAQKVLLGKRVNYVRLNLARKNVTTCLEVPFDESDVEKAEELVRHLMGRESSWNQKQVQAQSTHLTPSAKGVQT